MEVLPENEILKFHPDTLQKVRKMYNLDKPGEMEDAVDIFEAWIQQQNHFVKKDFNRKYLERMIIIAKGSIERAKGRLEKLCTLRTLIPQMFGDYDVKTDFKMLIDAKIIQVPLPKLTSNNERIIIVRYSNNNTTEMLLNSYKRILMIIEYIKVHDYATGYRFLFDLREVNITEFVTKMSVMDLRNLSTLITEGYGIRLPGIHLLTNNKMVDLLVALMRQAMSAKLGGRIIVNKSLESLYEYIPKEVLPAGYGTGDSRTADEIFDQWLDVLSSEEFRDHYRSMNAACTNESLRPTDQFNDQYMGMPGTFRVLRVD